MLDGDKDIFKFIYALLGLASILIPGPIVPCICGIIAIVMLVTKIKAAKESPEGFEMLMLDIVIIGAVLIVSLFITVYRIWIVADYMKYQNIYSSDSENMTIDELAQTLIAAYQLGNLSQFSDNSNNLSAIKNGFTTFLQEEMEIEDVEVNKNKITCSIGTEQIIFTVTKNDIKYRVK